LSKYQALFKQTFIYGLATVLPRMFSFLLVPLYTSNGMLTNAEYGSVTILFSYIIFFNVVLSYGMETAFFRFFHQHNEPNDVAKTSLYSLLFSSFGFLFIVVLAKSWLAKSIGISEDLFTYAIWILFLDALVVIPFAQLRAEKRPVFYAIIKITNVGLMLLLNVFFLMVLPKLFDKNPLLQSIYFPDAKVNYVFVSNLLASAFTFLVFIPKYWLAKGNFDWSLWKKMIRYGFPILLAGIAFAINEHLDKILLEKLHVPMAQIGSYSACYKIGVFMVLYRTAFTLGIEPFFFSQAKEKDAPQTYANVTKYFVIFGSIITYVVILFSDILKPFLIRNESYWDAMTVVPIIVIANFFLGIYTNLSVWYKVVDKTWIGAVISLIGALCTLLINWWTIPVLGYVGSALATIGAYGSMLLLSYVWGQKKYPIPYDWKTMGMYLMLAFSGSLVYFYGYRENYWIGFGILLVLLLFTFYQQKAFLQKIIPTWKK